jgi:inner membrane protein
MEIVMNWQMYLVLGLLLMIAEAFISTFFLFPIGVSLLLTALIAPYANLTVELVFFSLMSILTFIFSMKYIKPRFMAKKNLSGVDSLVGRVVPVFEEINESTGTGSVKVYADEWRALPTEINQVISKNERVKIDKIEGNKVYVSRI